ncbi:uncharacterized protein [Euwallacea similis]|uniref:uncharacterized protein n=1 Tax=Euwallacea similis TaxID=1736056 RepID=UPI00344C39AC
MNQNHPSFSTNFAPYDEAFWPSARTSIHDETLRSSEAQARRCRDLRDSSVIGKPTGQFGVQAVICAQKHSFPGGVTFTLNPSSVPYINVGCRQCCNCTPTSPPSSLNLFNYPQSSPTLVNTFFPSSIDYPQYEYYSHQILPPTNQYQLKFHQDRSTATSDLVNHRSQTLESSGYPGERFGILENVLKPQDNLTFCHKIENNSSVQFSFPAPQINNSPYVKISSLFYGYYYLLTPLQPRKLHLRKPTPSPINHVVDSLVENQGQPKQVSFADPNERPSFKDESSQVSSECICRDENYKNKSKSKKAEDVNNPENSERKERRQRGGRVTPDTSSEHSSSDYCLEHSADKLKHKTSWKRRNESSEGSSQSSDSNDSKGNKKGKRGSKNKNVSNIASGNKSQSSISDQTESGSESDSRYSR